jgi:hypothetical protein
MNIMLLFLIFVGFVMSTLSVVVNTGLALAQVYYYFIKNRGGDLVASAKEANDVVEGWTMVMIWVPQILASSCTCTLLDPIKRRYFCRSTRFRWAIYSLQGEHG